MEKKSFLSILVQAWMILMAMGWVAMAVLYPHLPAESLETIDWSLYVIVLASFICLRIIDRQKEHRFLLWVFLSEIILTPFICVIWGIFYQMEFSTSTENNVLWALGFNGIFIITFLIPVLAYLIGNLRNN